MATFMCDKSPGGMRVGPERAATTIQRCFPNVQQQPAGNDAVVGRMPQTTQPEDGSAASSGVGCALPDRGSDGRLGRFARNSAFGSVAGLAGALGGVLGSVIVAH